jgi:hypothetical protein
VNSSIQKEILSKIENVKTMIDLNSLIDTLFDNKDLIPLSLKKVSKSVVPKIIINREIDKDLPDFKIESFIIQNDPLKGIGSKISTSSYWKYRDSQNVDKKERVLNLDSSNTSKKQNIDAEVEGSSSRHGKISLNALKRIIETSRIQEIQKISDFKDLEKLNIDELVEYCTVLTNNIKSLSGIIIKYSSKGSSISTSQNKLISKIQSLQVLLCFYQMKQVNEELANQILTKIMRYALSIQTDKFETPRYLRVI